MLLTYYKQAYGLFLAASSIGATKVIAGSFESESPDYLLELGVGIAAAVLILREVFSFLKAQADNRAERDLQEVRDLVQRIYEKLSSRDSD